VVPVVVRLTDPLAEEAERAHRNIASPSPTSPWSATAAAAASDTGQRVAEVPVRYPHRREQPTTTDAKQRENHCGQSLPTADLASVGLLRRVWRVRISPGHHTFGRSQGVSATPHTRLQHVHNILT
jgi:hypothetical protein